MRCPYCDNADTRVVDSRPVEEGRALRRRRACDGCNSRFTTHERLVQAPIILAKKDGRREEFSADKLRNGVAKACNKRSVSTEQINQLVADVEATLRQDSSAEIPSAKVGELVMERLFQLDQVAYVRFASVYQRFDDVRRFAQLLERMSRRARGPKSSTMANKDSGDIE